MFCCCCFFLLGAQRAASRLCLCWRSRSFLPLSSWLREASAETFSTTNTTVPSLFVLQKKKKKEGRKERKGTARHGSEATWVDFSCWAPDGEKKATRRFGGLHRGPTGRERPHITPDKVIGRLSLFGYDVELKFWIGVLCKALKLQVEPEEVMLDFPLCVFFVCVCRWNWNDRQTPSWITCSGTYLRSCPSAQNHA